MLVILDKWTKNAEFLATIHDLLALEEVQQLKDFDHHHVTTRFDHSMNVAWRAWKWAKRWNLDTTSMARAGVLHDLFFYRSCDKHLVCQNHNLEHPQIAISNAKKITDLSSKEEEIMQSHMFGSVWTPPKSVEGWLFTYVDKHTAIVEVCYGWYAHYKNKLKKLPVFI